MNQYEWKQAQRRQRLELAAQRAASAGNAALDSARTMLDCIPPGQPILVGHYSEKRHRGLLRRHDNRMRSGFAKLKEAEEYARRAASVGTGGISSDDPEAIAKLTEKRSDLEVRRDWMKAANKHWKKYGTFTGSDIPVEIQAEGIRNMNAWHGVYSTPFPSYAISNLGARIRDANARAAKLERLSTATAQTVELAGATVEADPEDNRVTIRFESRLSRENYKAIRSAGFVWSPTRGGFTRKLSGCSIDHAKRVAEGLL